MYKAKFLKATLLHQKFCWGQKNVRLSDTKTQLCHSFLHCPQNKILALMASPGVMMN